MPQLPKNGRKELKGDKIWYNFCMSLHHLHLRKRVSGRARHAYPAEKRSLRILDKAVYAAGLLGIATMVPQLFVIYGEKNATGFAPITWGMLALLNIPWVIYGIVHKEKPITLSYSLWFVVNALVFVGSLLY